jgi:hypothetical protein
LVRTAAAAAAVEELRQLTARDRYVLDVLAEHQALTAAQIARLKYDDLNTARKRLVLLHRRRVLDRFRDGVRPGSQPWRYTLGPIGAAIVAATRGSSVPRPTVHADRVLRLARSPRLKHLLGVNEFFVRLAAHARNHPHYALTWWLNEQRATAECAGLAHPDGLGTWTHRPGPDHQPGRQVGEREVTFFLEHDTGTESLHRLITKLGGYAEARLGDGPDHPVLFWLPSADRERNLHQLLDRRPPPVRVATAVHTHADGRDTDPADPVWLVPGTASRRRLIDVTSWADDQHVDGDRADQGRAA